MKKVVIYSTELCPFCWMAKRLFAEKEVGYHEIDIIRNPEARDEMVTKSGGRTSVPQIFIGEIHVGGSDELHDLEAGGKLDNLLGLD